MERIIYADYAATAPLRACAREAMEPWMGEGFYNPSGRYPGGWAAREALETAREDVAACIGAKAEEIFFTSGGTEADNWAMAAGRRRLVSAVEHDAVWLACGRFRRTLKVDRLGQVQMPDMLWKLCGFHGVVSVMLVNNEVGTLEPVGLVREMAGQNAVLHTDAVQAVGHIPVDVGKLGVDMLSMSAHKFGGPNGVGALYVRRGLKLRPLLRGGGQEGGLRSGTENVAGAVGMAAALKAAVAGLDREVPRLTALGERLIRGVLDRVPGALLTGPRVGRLPGHASFLFPKVNGHALVLALGDRGVYASSGSACHAGSGRTSRVLKAMGYSEAEARGALRLTLGEGSTEGDVDHILEVLPECVERSLDVRGQDI